MSVVFKRFARHAMSALMSCIALSLPVPAGAQASLYERLGGIDRLSAIVSRTLDRTASDPRTRAGFTGLNMDHLKASETAHLCQLTGGPCGYAGATMREAHTGLGITPEQFDIMQGYLIDAMHEHGVGDAEQQELLSRLAMMKHEVVGK